MTQACREFTTWRPCGNFAAAAAHPPRATRTTSTTRATTATTTISPSATTHTMACCTAPAHSSGKGINSPAPFLATATKPNDDDERVPEVEAPAEVDDITVELATEADADESACECGEQCADGGCECACHTTTTTAEEEEEEEEEARRSTSPALSLEPATPEPAAEPAEPMPDTELTAGTRITVDGMGEGTYVAFKASWIGANTHTIEFDSGETQKMKLRDHDWRIISEPATANESAEAAADPPPVPDTTPPVIPATPVAEPAADCECGREQCADGECDCACHGTEETAEEPAEREPMPDTELPAGTRVAVDGMGGGTYGAFKAGWLASSDTHTIEFDSGETKTLALGGPDLRILATPGAATGEGNHETGHVGNGETGHVGGGHFFVIPDEHASSTDGHVGGERKSHSNVNGEGSLAINNDEGGGTSSVSSSRGDGSVGRNSDTHEGGDHGGSELHFDGTW